MKTRISRVRTDLGPTVPYYARAKRCEYLHPSDLAPIPEGLIIACKWHGQYDRAYHVGGKWYLAWDSREMPEPEGVQVWKGLYE